MVAYKQELLLISTRTLASILKTTVAKTPRTVTIGTLKNSSQINFYQFKELKKKLSGKLVMAFKNSPSVN